MGEYAIRTEGLSKKFGLTLRQSMKYGLRDAAQRLLGRKSATDVLRPGEFWAVDDVSFELRSGQALGIMGVNGSGKTTLLRILNGVYAPDRGRVRIRGRVGALIAAGAGFAPMLSGRENVYVNGSLLGLSTKEINGLMDEIVAFSELGEFIDLPVKNYSSGMSVRLGFAVAALSRPDVLLMDEVLAVGDLNFQKKCFDQILQLKRTGTAIILVSHSPGAIWSVCERGLFMDHGKVLVDGPTEDAIRAYDEQNARNSVASGRQFDAAAAKHDQLEEGELKAEYGHQKGGTGDIICREVQLFDDTGTPSTEFGFRRSFEIQAVVDVNSTQEQLLLRFTVDAVHYRFIATIDSFEQGLELPLVHAGRYKLRINVKAPNFRPGAYVLNLSASCREVGIHLFYWVGAARFLIKHPTDMFLYSDHNSVMHLDGTFSLEPMTETEGKISTDVGDLASY